MTLAHVTCHMCSRMQRAPFPFCGGFLCCAEIFRRREFYLSIFSFASLAHGDLSGQYCCEESLKFSCLGFLLGLLWFVVVFKSFLHFELIPVGGISGWSSCLLCGYLPISPALLMEETLSLPVTLLPPLSDTERAQRGGPFQGPFQGPFPGPFPGPCPGSILEARLPGPAPDPPHQFSLSQAPRGAHPPRRLGIDLVGPVAPESRASQRPGPGEATVPAPPRASGLTLRRRQCGSQTGRGCQGDI